MREYAVISGPVSEGEIAQEAIREELSRILESSIFVQSDRLGRFLRYTIETTLAGDAETLKEYLIGTEVYDRKPPYHPSVDSIVRSEARRLRTKLKEYYESVGRNDSVFIYYRPGSYVPAFRRHDNQEGGGLAMDRALRELLTEGLVAEALEVPSVSEGSTCRSSLKGRYAYCAQEQNHQDRRNRGPAEALRNGFNSGR